MLWFKGHQSLACPGLQEIYGPPRKRLTDVPLIRQNLAQSHIYHIYQPPPLGQDMTQGQFLSGV